MFCLLALLASSFSLPLVLALALVDGVLMLTARGLSRGATNSVLHPKGLLREGNGLLNVGFAASSVGGAALGGLLVDLFGVEAALLVDAGSFAVVAIVLATCRHLPRGEGEPEPFLARLRSGLRYARTNRVTRLLIGGEGLAIVFFTLIVPIEIVYASETLHTDDLGYGVMLSAWGAGIVLGSVVFLGVRRRPASALILLSTLAIGCAYLGMAVARELWVACAFSILGGLGNGVQWVSVMTALQESTPGDLQARITGLLESIVSAATGVGFLIGGVITAATRRRRRSPSPASGSSCWSRSRGSSASCRTRRASRPAGRTPAGPRPPDDACPSGPAGRMVRWQIRSRCPSRATSRAPSWPATSTWRRPSRSSRRSSARWRSRASTRSSSTSPTCGSSTRPGSACCCGWSPRPTGAASTSR